MNKLVSVVSPCYNGESYIARYLDSMIKQTYRPLEIILVNDGSTDKTEDIIMSYSEKLATDKIYLKYIKKQNGGTGAAVNDALKHITGDFLIWPDTDDILLPDSIEKRVAFLENNPEYGFVYSDGLIYTDTNTDSPTGRVIANIPANGDIFRNVLSGNIVYNPCGYMLRMNAFLDVNPKKEIFPSRYGQNIQMLLPISYKYRCGHIKEPLYGRVDREGSLSKKVWKESDTAWKNRVLGLEEIYVQTLKSIGGDALAYIPYIYYRNHRILAAIAKNVGKAARSEQSSILRKSTKLLFAEMIKTIFKRW